MYIYNVILTLGGGADLNPDPILRRRSLESIEVFAQELQALFPNLPETKILADLVGGPLREPPSAVALGRALQLCISSPDVVHSTCLSQFLWDREDYASAEDSTPTAASENERSLRSATDFILQPVEMVTEYIPPRSAFSQDFYLRKGETILWRFSVGGGYDIEFSVLWRGLSDGLDPTSDAGAFSVVESVSKERLDAFTGQGADSHTDPVGSAVDVVAVVPPQRVLTPAGPGGAQGSYSSQRAGFARLRFDNGYSRINGKHISYAVQVVGDDVLQAAFRAAEDVEETLQRSYSSAYRRILRSSEEVRVSVDGPWRDHIAASDPPSTALNLRGAGSYGDYIDDLSPKGAPGDAISASHVEEQQVAAVRSLPLADTDTEAGVVQRYVESGADHTRVVSSAGAGRIEWAGGDVVLDDSFSPSSPSAAKTGPPTVRPGGWLGAAVGAIAQVYGADGSLTLPVPPPPAANAVGAAGEIAVRPAINSYKGYYYPISPAALYDASTALLQMVWRGYGLPSGGQSESGAGPLGAGCGEPDTQAGAGHMADLLRIAQHVDELEDRNAILTAERDQAKAIGIRDALAVKMAREDVVSVEAMLSIQERHTQEWRERANTLEVENAALRVSLADSQREAASLRAALSSTDEIKKQAESALLEKSVWGSTKEGVQRQLSEATDRADQERRRAEEATARADSLETQADSLTLRIIELERALAAAGGEPSSARVGAAGDRDREVREYASRVQELQAQLQVSECQGRIEEGKLRQQLRRNSAMLALAKTEAAECRMMADMYKEKLTKVKAQKKVLVSELRGLRDLGIYEGRITVDHAAPLSGSLSRQPSSLVDQMAALDKDINLDSAASHLRPVDTVARAQSPHGHREQAGHGNDSRDSPTSAIVREKGINFSVLKLASDPSVATADRQEEAVIDFMSEPSSDKDTGIAPAEPAIGSAGADEKTMSALRHARLRQQTVSLILQDDPGNIALKGLLDQLNSDVGSLQTRLTGGASPDDTDDFDLPPHDAWMSTVQQGDDRAV